MKIGTVRSVISGAVPIEINGTNRTEISHYNITYPQQEFNAS